MRRAARRDGNESEIIEALQAVGCSVLQLDEIDLVVGWRGRNFLLEVKMPKRRRKLRPIQERLSFDWRGQYSIVTSVDEALAAVGALGSR